MPTITIDFYSVQFLQTSKHPNKNRKHRLAVKAQSDDHMARR